MAEKREKKYYDINDIMETLPHRYPILLVDRVLEVTETGGKGYRNVTMNDQFFLGHFPGAPVMPGVLIIEGMAQCSGFIALKLIEKETNNDEKKLIYFMSINNAKFRKPVMPGDRLDYEIEIIRLKGKIAKFQGYAKVDGELVAEAEMMAMIVPKNEAR